MKKDTTTATSVIDKTTYDPNDPESVDSFWEGSTIEHNGEILGMTSKAILRGIQKKPTKIQVTIRLSPEILNFFKSTGKGWQTRMNDTLLEYIQSLQGTDESNSKIEVK